MRPHVYLSVSVYGYVFVCKPRGNPNLYIAFIFLLGFMANHKVLCEENWKCSSRKRSFYIYFSACIKIKLFVLLAKFSLPNFFIFNIFEQIPLPWNVCYFNRLLCILTATPYTYICKWWLHLLVNTYAHIHECTHRMVFAQHRAGFILL